MNPIRQVIATSFLFHQTIPQVWAVKELLRVSRTLEDDEEHRALPIHEQVVQVVTSLLEQNPEIPLRQVYGLTAVQLCRLGILQDSQAMVCTLVKKTSDDPLELPEILSNNHRYFVYGAHDIDPLFQHYEDRGHDVYINDPYRIDAPPTSLIQGFLDRVISGNQGVRIWEDGTNKHLSWFRKVVHRISRRMNLTPDWWRRKDAKGIRARKGFEGYIRELIPRFEEESKHEWRQFLKEALQTFFTNWPEDSIDNFIIRINQEFGPEPPATQYIPKRKVRMVNPDTQHIHPSGLI